MYVIRHIPTYTFYGMKKSDSDKTKVCCFPNMNHAKQVADNLAKYHFANNEFPEPKDFKVLMRKDNDSEYCNEFTPYNTNIYYETYDMYIDQITMDFIDYCGDANLDIMFCVLSEKKVFNDSYLLMFDMNLKNKERDEYLDKCYYLE